jgi:hypothetical protein
MYWNYGIEKNRKEEKSHTGLPCYKIAIRFDIMTVPINLTLFAGSGPTVGIGVSSPRSEYGPNLPLPGT